MAFSWVPFYRELGERVLEFENRQDELLAVLREMQKEGLPCVPLQDNQPDDSQKPLEEIDPFTFMANMARVEMASAIRLSTWLARKWDLATAVPADFKGCAAIQPRSGNSWFFGSVRSGRQPEDVGHLWTLARQALEANMGDIDFELLQTCMNQNNVGFYKLTKGLSWFSPKGFLPLNDTMLTLLKGKGIRLNRGAIARGEANEYLKAMQSVEKLNTDLLSLVAEAQSITASETVEVEAENIMPLNVPKTPLNQILYGPPGTGKTFNVVRRAVEIIESDFSGDFKTRFEELRSQGQIGFVTFHQSFSYEEFIEGLRPVLDDEDGQAKYEIRDGILKTMARNANENRVERSLGGRMTFEQVLDKLWEKLPEMKWQIPGISDGNRKPRGLYEIREKKEIYVEAKNVNGQRDKLYWVPVETLRVCWEGLEKGAYPDSPTLRAIWGKGFYCNLAGAVIAQMQVIEEQLQPNAKTIINWPSSPRFVLIIDEINRGNISKILGELITLLEDDKRLGEPNELRLTLPVSGETFALPPNLFILGTMNTADKSLAGLDVALRRRFSFKEMAPDFGVCEGLPGEMRKVLERLNERLEWAIDREHRLGHAPWMSVRTSDDFNAVWREKIMPLLVELFADNLEALRDVLRDGDSKSGFVRPFAKPEGMKGRERLRLYLDCDDAREFDAFSVLKKNLGVG